MVTPDASPAARHAPMRGFAPASSYSTRRDRGTMTAARSLKSSCALASARCVRSASCREFHIVDGCKAEADTLHGKKMKTIDCAPKLAPSRRLATDPDCCAAGGLHPGSRRKRQWRVSDIDCHLEPHISDLTPIARCPSDTARGSAQLLTLSEFARRFGSGFARSPIDSRPDHRCADAGDPSFDQSALADALARHHKHLGPRSADRDDTDSVNCPARARKVHDDFAALQAKQVMSRSLGSCTRAHGEHIDMAGDDSAKHARGHRETTADDCQAQCAPTAAQPALPP